VIPPGDPTRSVLRQRVSVEARYELIDAEKRAFGPDGRPRYTVVQMCSWLGVSSSGYYEWRVRPQSATAARRETLKQLIVVIFEASDETYGHRRIHASLLRSGQSCSVELVRALVRQLGLVPCQPRPWRHSLTEMDPAAGPIPDLVRRGLHRVRAGREDGRRYYVHSDLGGLGIPRHRD
jgi:putative transposase